MRKADKLGSHLVLIVGEDELSRGKVVVRHLDSKEQFEVGLEQVEDGLVERLGTGQFGRDQ